MATMPSLCIDARLAAAFEGAEVVACRAFCRATAEIHPGRGIRTIECAGGIGNFYGPSNPLNAVKGVGLHGPVDAAAWEALEGAYAETRSPVVVDFCPLADEGFSAMLSERGYRITSFETVTFKDLNSEEPAPAADGVRIEEVDLRDGAAIDAWTHVLDVGFADGGEPIKFEIDFGKARALMASRDREAASMLLATVDGEPAGGAALSIRRANGDFPLIAMMSGAAVLPKFRRRGIQGVLTAARLRVARKHGCEFATLCVKAGSASHRNACRAGFSIAYTRPQLTGMTAH